MRLGGRGAGIASGLLAMAAASAWILLGAGSSELAFETGGALRTARAPHQVPPRPPCEDRNDSARPQRLAVHACEERLPRESAEPPGWRLEVVPPALLACAEDGRAREVARWVAERVLVRARDPADLHRLDEVVLDFPPDDEVALLNVLDAWREHGLEVEERWPVVYVRRLDDESGTSPTPAVWPPEA